MELPETETPALAGEGVVARLDAQVEQRACVLIVDDNPAKLLSLTAVVSGTGLDTVTACSGRAALRQMLVRDFALILLDVNMPVMDGYETAQLIHSRPRSAHTPIIFVTAEAASETERFKAYTAGAVDWIFSPIVPEILQAKVNVFVELYYLTRIAQQQAEQLRRRAGEIERQNAQLEEASRLKSDFLASMSHELRTPLNAIIGFSALMQDGILGELTAQQKEAADNIRSAGNHLLSLINDILDLSKIEAGKMTLEAEPVAVAALLEASLMVVREKALGQRIDLRLELAPELGEIVVDVRKFRQILFNLLSNAVKFTPDGGTVCLAARRVRCAGMHNDVPQAMAAYILPLPAGAGDDFLEIEVSDNGIGIAESDLHRLFNNFVRLDSSLGRRFDGTGLGLALVRQMAALHGGTVGVVSAIGQGSRFLVWLPWRGAGARTGQRAAPEAALAAALPAPPEAARPLALAIEDDELVARIVATELDSIGFRVMLMRAADAQTGLARAAREVPALITLDLLSPGQGGWDALERIKADPVLASIPVLIVTASAEQGLAYVLGAIAVLQKPASRDALLGVIGKLGLIDAPHSPLVLLVDDDPAAPERVARTLSAAGCDVVRANGGHAAITMAQQILPDLVILDLMMSTIDGFDVVEVLKTRTDTANVPILILIAKEVTASERERLGAYVAAIVLKSPFQDGAFLREVARAVGKNRPLIIGQEGI